MLLDLDSGDKVASIVAGAIALLGGILATVRAVQAGLRNAKEKRRVKRFPGDYGQVKPVCDVDLDALGVHRAIASREKRAALAVGRDDNFPSYATRDYDQQLRSAVNSANFSSRFVLLVGTSSTGKSRSAAEAIYSELHDWHIMLPLTAKHLEDALNKSDNWNNVVLWLNELQMFLGDPREAERISAKIVSLLARGQRLLVIGTLWPEYVKRYTRGTEEAAQSPALRALFSKAVTITVPARLSKYEIKSLRDIAEMDSAIRIALTTATGSEGAVTQTLAAGPDLIAHWTAAPSSFAASPISAAIDAKMLGVMRPLTWKQLEKLSLSELSPAEEARAYTQSSWFEFAMEYATELLRGAVSALQPRLGEHSGEILYDVADYLYEHGKNARLDSPISDRFWISLGYVIDDGDDLERLADSAKQRDMPVFAENLYHAAIRQGNFRAAVSLVDLLISALRIDEAEEILAEVFELRPSAVWVQYYRFLRSRGRKSESEALLREAITAGVKTFAGGRYVSRPYEDSLFESKLGYFKQPRLFGPESELSEFLEQQDRRAEVLEVWQQAVQRKVPFSRQSLASYLVKSGKTSEAERILRECVAEQEPGARYALASLLAKNGRDNEIADLWKEGVKLKEPESARVLSELMEKQGNIEDAERALRESISSGDKDSYIYLARLFCRLGRYSDAQHVLRQSWEDSTPGARQELGVLRACDGDVRAARELFESAFLEREVGAWKNLIRALLVQEYDSPRAVSVLESEVSRGTRGSVGMLCRLLMLQGDEVLAAARWREVLPFDDDNDQRGHAALHAWMGDLQAAEDALRECVSGGVRYAVTTLVSFLEEIGKHDAIEAEWRRAVTIGEFDARGKLADHLYSSGRLEAAEEVLRENLTAGDLNAGKRLGEFLINQHREDEAKKVLIKALASGEGAAIEMLFELLLKRGELREAEQLIRDKGHSFFSPKLCLARLHEAQGDIAKARRFIEEAAAVNEFGSKKYLLKAGASKVAPILFGDDDGEYVDGVPLSGISEEGLWRNFWEAKWESAHALADFLINRHRHFEAERVAKMSVVFGDYRSFLLLSRVQSAMEQHSESQRARLAAVASGEVK